MWAYARTIVYAAVAIPSTIVLARLLSPQDFGIAAAATFFGQLAGRLSNAGMGIALVRIKILRPEHVSSVFTVNAVLAALACAALLGGAPLVAEFYRTPEIEYVLPIVALDFALGSLAMVSQALLTRDLRYREMAAMSSGEMTVASLSAVAFAWAGLQYWSIPLGAVCGSAIKWLWGVRLVGWHLHFKFDPSAARELMSFALGTYTKGMLEYLSLNVDNVVIGRVLGITPLGYYDKAFSSVNRVYKWLTVVGPSVSFRAFAVMQDEPERFRRAFGKVMTTVTLTGYTGFAALGTMGPHLIVVLFGDRWQPSVIPFQLLCVAGALKISSAYASAAANARGWIWSNVWRQAVQVVLIVVSVYVAAPWGINGASAAVLGSVAVMFLLTQSLLRTATDIPWRGILRPQIPGLAMAATTAAVVWGVDVASRDVWQLHPPAILVLQAFATALLGAAFVLWCPFPAVRAVIDEILDDVSPRLARFIGRRHPGTGGSSRRTAPTSAGQ